MVLGWAHLSLVPLRGLGGVAKRLQLLCISTTLLVSEDVNLNCCLFMLMTTMLMLRMRILYILNKGGA
jgi:hypothetical protein